MVKVEIEVEVEIKNEFETGHKWKKNEIFFCGNAQYLWEIIDNLIK